MMKNFQWKSLLPHLIAVIVFALVAIIYCKPSLEGKVLQQSDVQQWKGMSKDMQDYKDKHGNWPLWTNGMFSGMPGYQIAIGAENPVSVTYLQQPLELFLSKPANFFFLASLCFYFLALVLGANPYLAMIGGLSYAYATYNPIIIGAGHDTKMVAIAYMPALIGSLILIYEKKYWWGAALTALSTALLIGANHLQITYYTLIIVFFLTIGYFVHWIKQKDFKQLFTSTSIAIVSALLGVMVNLVMLATTYEYSKATIRNGSALADGKNITKTGLSKEYAFSYSMYKTEPLVLMFPYLYGGSSFRLEVDQEKSKAIEALQQMPQQIGQQLQGLVSFYWGGIDGVGTSGPPYAGAIICFLAFLGFVLLDGKHKWWILGAVTLTTIMSWGGYFDGFNSLLLKYLPMYNKFRAPSMIMVVPTLLLCMMAVLTVQKIISSENKEELWQQYKKGLLVVTGIFVLALFVYFSADFSNAREADILKNISNSADAQQKAVFEQPLKSLIAGLKEDRKDLLLSSLLRSLFFIVVVGAVIWLFIKKKINSTVVVITVGVLAFIDIITIDNKYLNADNYQDDNESETVFKPSSSDAIISKDTSCYRVFNISQGVNGAFNGDAKTSYFHKSIGGYHPAKLSTYQDLMEKQLYNFPKCMPVINMLNTKYIIQGNLATDTIPNPDALGACWFVKGIKYTNGAAATMDALTNFNPKDTAVVEEKFNAQIHSSNDSTAKISLIKNDNDVVEYHSSSKMDGYAVFSEIFYDAGWKASIDGKEATIIPTNYVLRGLEVPAGNHKITFEFKPASFYSSTKLAMISSALIWLLVTGAAFQTLRAKKSQA